MNYFVVSYLVIISDISSEEEKSKEHVLRTKLTGEKNPQDKEVNYQSGKYTHAKWKTKSLK